MGIGGGVHAETGTEIRRQHVSSACGVVSLAECQKGAALDAFELSATQLAAVVMTLAPWRHGLYVWTAGLQAFALGLAFFANNCSIGPQALFCSLTTTRATWRGRRTGRSGR